MAAYTGEDDDDEVLANFLESEILQEDARSAGAGSIQPMSGLQDAGDGGGGIEEGETVEDEGGTRAPKRPRAEKAEASSSRRLPPVVVGFLIHIPPELFHHILKFLSSEDLIACSLVCRVMNMVASDECLWRRLYCMRWGLATRDAKLRESAWKKLYIQRDKEDMIEFVRNSPTEFKEYYIQMQAAKRSQAPLPSLVYDDQLILDRTIADQVSIWKRNRGLSEENVVGHVCSGNTCSYSQIGDVFVCEKTGRVHVCDDTCRETVLDNSGTLVCTISGHCFERLLLPGEETDGSDEDLQQGGGTDEVEPFMGSGRFARAYMLGYNCHDEKELEAALRFC